LKRDGESEKQSKACEAERGKTVSDVRGSISIVVQAAAGHHHLSFAERAHERR
jgi:hypothetical protein